MLSFRALNLVRTHIEPVQHFHLKEKKKIEKEED